jgi:glycosyltransferase involved in cell wall biosynthesis
LKVLLQSRCTLFTVPGGDTIQILKTKEYLVKLGVSIDISTDLEPDLSDYDIVHLFNLIRPQDILIQARNAKRQGKKIVLSTIYGLYTEYDRTARTGFAKLVSQCFPTSSLEYFKTVARGVKNRELHKGTLQYLVCGHKRAQREIASFVDVFLPNSFTEKQRVLDDFPSVYDKPFVVVPNAVDIAIFNPDKIVVSDEVEKLTDCVLCVARIEGRKSQINLVRALKDLPWTLVLIGKPAPNHIGYFEQLINESGNNIRIIGQIEHELLPQFYKAAKVHALISWMETPGLSSLEAAAMGCNLVITGKGDTREYFRDYAYYCEPDSVESIRNALIKAYEAPVDPALRQHVVNNFTWEKTAIKTLEGYEHAIKN